MAYKIIRPRRAPLTREALRILEAIEAFHFGHALGGEYRERRTPATAR